MYIQIKYLTIPTLMIDEIISIRNLHYKLKWKYRIWKQKIENANAGITKTFTCFIITTVCNNTASDSGKI
jgi:hypothetical protein